MTAARLERPVAVVAAGAVSALGFTWRGLGGALAEAAGAFGEASSRCGSHPGVFASGVFASGVPALEVPAIPAGADAGDARQHKLMSRAARLAAVAARQALVEAGLGAAREGVGYFLGVGASGGAITDLLAVIRASLEGDRISLAKLGDKGLSATNPVATFQLLNNFTMCHSAILEGTSGPNGAFFSRGGGTVFALMEAAAAIAEGDCAYALAGGADSALHPVTWAELVREGYAGEGLVPGEGAGVVVLAREHLSAIAFLEHCSVVRGGSLPSPPDPLSLKGEGEMREGEQEKREVREREVSEGKARWGDVDLVVLAPWGRPAREALQSMAEARCPGARVLDCSARLGDALAAAPALAWAAALDCIASGTARRALVLSAGIDGQVGAVVLAKEPSC